MAKVRLSYDQCRHDDLPSLCARCGKPSDVKLKRVFKWHPSWVIVLILFGLLPFVIVALLTTKRMKVNVPLCEEHQSHWWHPKLFGCITLPLLLLLFFIGIVMIPDRPAGNDDNTVAMGLWITGLAGFVVCLFAVAIWGSTRIRPLNITDESILLAGVSDEFADEAKRLREGDSRGYGDYDDRDSRRKSKGGRYDEEDRDDDRDRRRGRDDDERD